MSTPRAPRMGLSLEPDIAAVLKRVSSLTNVTETGIVSRILAGLLGDLIEYADWLAVQEPGSKKQILGANLMTSYGPSGLLAGIKSLDPDYQTDAERFAAAVKNAELDPEWLASLNAAVAAKKAKG